MILNYKEHEVYEKWYRFIVVRKLWRPGGNKSMPDIENWYFLDESRQDNIVVKSRSLEIVMRAFKEAVSEVLLENYHSKPTITKADMSF